jgi:hypothetical protein
VGLGALLARQPPSLLVLAGLALLVLAHSALTVWQHGQRGVGHELLVLSAVCPATPFAWTAGTGSIPPPWGSGASSRPWRHWPTASPSSREPGC